MVGGVTPLPPLSGPTTKKTLFFMCVFPYQTKNVMQKVSNKGTMNRDFSVPFFRKICRPNRENMDPPQKKILSETIKGVLPRSKDQELLSITSRATV